CGSSSRSVPMHPDSRSARKRKVKSTFIAFLQKVLLILINVCRLP
ncbi:MAG: hypothetical protein AVDCRST_MAG95-3594, partial [uncultured Adhaeribacter sp.]